MQSAKPTILITLLALALTACAGYPLNGDNYSHRSALEAQPTELATVVAVRPVSEVNQDNTTGTLLGGAAGGIAASTVGHGAGRALATLGGAAVGAYAGSQAQKLTSGHNPAFQITVRRQRSGRLTTVVQRVGRARFHRGQQVLYIRGRNTRIEPIEG
jgi:outer membrane lipoprotein SlyB